MRTIFKLSVLGVALAISTSMFVNCDNANTKRQPVAIVETPEETIELNSKEEVSVRNPLVFITGFDKGSETYYNNARAYFRSQNMEIVEGQYSIEEIISWLNNNAGSSVYGDIHIVNKSNPFVGLSLETTIKGDYVNAESLRKSITKGTLPILGNSVTSNSRIVFHADGLSENTDLVATLKDAFCSEELPSVVTTSYHSIFDGEFSQHYLAKPYYVFYPTAHSPGKVDLSKEIAKKYPNEKDINWYDALNNESERFIGEAYYTQYTIPVKFELDYHNSDDEMPTFTMQEEIMDFIDANEYLISEMEKLNIPLEKFRWSYSVKNSTLTIKGKTSVLCVLKPLIKPYGELEHVEPDTTNKRLYAMK